jgi:4-amino-4-deoxy-L-arabinose transferase-like glycosyltransferase
MLQRGEVSPRLIILLLLTWAVLLIRVDAPMYGIQEAPRLWISSAVRNYYTYDLQTTGLMMIRNPEITTPENFEYYSHHPPLVAWLPGLMTALAGLHDVSIRYGFIAATLLSVVALYVFVRRLYGEQIAFWSAPFYALVPMVAYYGRVPGMGQLSVAVGLLFGAVMFNWIIQPTRHRFFALTGLAWIAVWTAWQAVFFIAMFGVVALIPGNWRQRFGVIILGIVSLTALLALVCYYQFHWEGALPSLLDSFFFRASSASDAPASSPITLSGFIIQNVVHTATFVTPGIVLMSLFGVLPLLRQGSRLSSIMLVGLLLGGLSYQLVFRNGSYVHDYYKFNLVPTLAILAATAWVNSRSGQRYLRPIMDGLLIVAIVSGIGWLTFLHGSGNRPWLDEVIATINSRIPADVSIWTNLEGRDRTMPITYYTRRTLQMGKSYEEAAQAAGKVVYLYCQFDDAGCQFTFLEED